MKKHLTSLSLLAEVWTDWGGYWAPDLVASALHPMASAPPVHRGATLKTAAFIAENQREDGTWSNADLFHTLEALLAANTPPARKAVARAVPALLALQRKDGSFGPTAQEERALIAVRAMVAVGVTLAAIMFAPAACESREEGQGPAPRTRPPAAPHLAAAAAAPHPPAAAAPPPTPAPAWCSR